MNAGRGRERGGRNFVWRARSPQSGGRNIAVPRSSNASLTPETGSSNSGKRNPEIAVSADGVTRKSNVVLPSDYPPVTNTEHFGNISSNVGKSKQVQDDLEAKQASKLLDSQSVAPGRHDDFPALSSHPVPVTRTTQMEQPRDDEKEVICKAEELSQNMSSSSQVDRVPREAQSGNSDHTGTIKKVVPFDICEERNRNIVRLKTPLHVKNKAVRNDMKRRMQGENIKNFSRSGMILLKSYIPLKDQVNLIKSCQDLGLGPGGFYQPGYRDGATLHLKMMCLGRHWDPETSKYYDTRPTDKVKPPPIPDEFQRWVKQAIQECHDYLESRSIIPSMSPDICIINFYTRTGRLGLHQDKDESPESLRKGLPVVSFSLGDSAQFLFGDQKDIDKADEVLLESGDVLIFGGKSRHVFHGVSSIIPDTAPKDLLEETHLKPGRLNLTFRKY